MAEDLSLADLGEWELIRRLGRFAPRGQFLDDAALLELEASVDQGTSPLVISTDVLVEDVHFSERTTSGFDVGWRAAAANLSDLAAMGCTEPIGLTVGLVAPPTTSWAWVEAVYQGMAAALEGCGGVLLGGDCSRGRERTLAITAVGQLRPEAGGAIRRRDGRPGDLLVSTGPHGLSRLGLELLLGQRETGSGWDPPTDLRARAIRAHQRPTPRFDAVRALQQSRPTGRAWRVGGCDSSDGLAGAVAVVAAASRCGAVLKRFGLPLDPGMEVLEEAEAWCLGGGEDFELVLSLDPDWAEALVDLLPEAVIFGELESDGSAPGQPGSRPPNRPPLRWAETGEAISSSSEGFTHFRP